MYIKSPINYTGCKYKILDQLIPRFPKKINTFVDLFGGSGTVSLNIEAEHIIYNEIIHYLPMLFNEWKGKNHEGVISNIEKIISKYQLSKTNKEGFLKLRETWNERESSDTLTELFILICYSFNYQMRFNNQLKYNSSFGANKSSFNESIKERLKSWIETTNNKDIIFTNKNFKDFDWSDFDNNDFVYLDPPYSLSRGVYQDSKGGFNGWSKKDDIDLFNMCDKLDNQGVRWGMSNLFYSKGNYNDDLIKWAEKYKIVDISKSYSNSNYQRKNKDRDQEVYIYNY